MIHVFAGLKDKKKINPTDKRTKKVSAPGTFGFCRSFHFPI
jgi:hypothetical protein